MLNRVRLVRNVGQFDSVDGAANIALSRVTLLYAENGRGKTTLAAILRSLATNDPLPIAERRRLAAANPPHVVIECGGVPPAAVFEAVFENNAWNRSLPNIVLFDDLFVDQNVCSGLDVAPAHRHNLHELILGAQGVAINRTLQRCVERIEQHNKALREKANAIPASARRNMAVDQFCSLSSRDDIDAAIQATERNLAAVREQEPIRRAALFDVLALPAFDAEAIDALLRRNIADLDAEAVVRVRQHLDRLGTGAEEWVAEGMRRLTPSPPGGDAPTCPFCAQALSGSPVIVHYRAYFSAAYADLRRDIAEAVAALNRDHNGDVPAAFERAVRIAGERRQFWSRFCDLPAVAFETVEVARAWRAAREAVAVALQAKQAAPLDRLSLPHGTRDVVAEYESHRQAIAELSRRLQQANGAIRVVKEQAATGNAAAITADLARLKAVKARHTPEIATLCTAYLNEKAAKADTEKRREQAKAALRVHRARIFPAYETAINEYLRRFNAGFRLGRVRAADSRTGPTCTYGVVINETEVPVSSGNNTLGEPSFRTTLSSGDRSTLALAFFFASLDQDSARADKIVVIDDPITSLDEHRSLTTVQEMRRLAERVAQLIVLSHDKPFLCRVWEGLERNSRAALQLDRDVVGSTIRAWDVNQDSITEHDRRHALLRDYTESSTPNGREVARSLRPHLEAFLRVAYPKHFPPGTLLGSFVSLCEQRVGTRQQILNADDTRELRESNEFARRFHHDTNQAWETEAINDNELVGYVKRVLAFCRR